MVAELPALRFRGNLAFAPSGCTVMELDFRRKLASAVAVVAKWPPERRSLVLALLEDNLCRLCAVHAEVVLRWCNERVATACQESYANLAPTLLTNALQQDAHSSAPVLVVSGSTLLTAAVPANDNDKPIAEMWRHAVVQLHVSKLAKVLGMDLPIANAASTRAESTLPTFLFDYESPSSQGITTATQREATATPDLNVNLYDDTRIPSGQLLAQDDHTPSAADVAAHTSLPTDTPRLHAVHSTSPIFPGQSGAGISSARNTLQSDSVAIPQEVATCWFSAQSAAALAGGGGEGGHHPADLYAGNSDVANLCGSLAYPSSLHAGRRAAPSTSAGGSTVPRRSTPVSPQVVDGAIFTNVDMFGRRSSVQGGMVGRESYDVASSSTTTATAPWTQFMTNTPCSGSGLPVDDGTPSMQAYDRAVSAEVMLSITGASSSQVGLSTRLSAGLQPPSPATSVVTQSPAGSSYLAKIAARDASCSEPGTATFAAALSATPVGALDDTGAATHTPPSVTSDDGGGEGCQGVSDASAGPQQTMDLESALEAIISYESGSTTHTSSTDAAGVTAATAAAAHTSLQQHVQAAVRAAAERAVHAPARGRGADGMGLDGNFGRFSLESMGYSGAQSAGVLVGSAPTHLGGVAAYMQQQMAAADASTSALQAFGAAAATSYSGRLTAPELPLSPDALLAADQQRRAALPAVSRSVPRTTTTPASAWAAVVAQQQQQRKRTLNSLATAALAQSNCSWGSGIPTNTAGGQAGLDAAASLALLNGSLNNKPASGTTRLWPRLSPKLRSEVQQLLASLPGMRGEDLDDAVLYQLIASRQADEDVLAALRAVAAMSDLTSNLQQLSAFLPSVTGQDGLLSPPFSPRAAGAMLRHAASMPTPSSKAALQKLPSKVLTRLEEVIGRCGHLDWKHFDAGVVKVMVQLSDLSETDVLEELQLLEATDLSNVEYMPAYLNKRLNNRLWSRRKLQQAQHQAPPAQTSTQA